MIERIYISEQTGEHYIQKNLENMNKLLNDGYIVVGSVGSHNEFGYFKEHYTLWKPDELPTIEDDPQPPPQDRTMKGFLNMVRNDDFVVLDTETTGIHNGEIVQIAIINSKGETLLSTHVKPTRHELSDFNISHGITSDVVGDAPTWAEIFPTVRKLLTDVDVVVYNAVFDRKFLHKSNEVAGIDRVDWKVEGRWWCAMEMFAEFYGDWNDYHQSYRWQKLAFAASHMGVEVDNEHDALGDTLMTLGVVKAMAKAVPNA